MWGCPPTCAHFLFWWSPFHLVHLWMQVVCVDHLMRGFPQPCSLITTLYTDLVLHVSMSLGWGNNIFGFSGNFGILNHVGKWLSYYLQWISLNTTSGDRIVWLFFNKTVLVFAIQSITNVSWRSHHNPCSLNNRRSKPRPPAYSAYFYLRRYVERLWRLVSCRL